VSGPQWTVDMKADLTPSCPDRYILVVAFAYPDMFSGGFVQCRCSQEVHWQQVAGDWRHRQVQTDKDWGTGETIRSLSGGGVEMVCDTSSTVLVSGLWCMLPPNSPCVGKSHECVSSPN